MVAVDGVPGRRGQPGVQWRGGRGGGGGVRLLVGGVVASRPTPPPMERHKTSNRRRHKKTKDSGANALVHTARPARPASDDASAPRIGDADLEINDEVAHVTDALPALTLSNGTNGAVEHDESPQTSPESRRPDSSEETVVSCKLCDSESCVTPGDIRFESYRSELQMADIMKLIQKDLSEPYSIYTYRYFIHNWPKLCFLAMHDSKCIGAIVCKLDLHRTVKRGYIAMLAVDEKYRKRKIGSMLVTQAIQVMISDRADEVVLETEITNKPALKLYENLGFVRDKRLFRYYLNGVDALRLKLWLR